jgi:hypothetical protein
MVGFVATVEVKSAFPVGIKLARSEGVAGAAPLFIVIRFPGESPPEGVPGVWPTGLELDAEFRLTPLIGGAELVVFESDQFQKRVRSIFSHELQFPNTASPSIPCVGSVITVGTDRKVNRCDSKSLWVSVE